MPLTVTLPAPPAHADVLESFMDFPAPLALFNEQGQMERINSRFLKSLGFFSPDAGKLDALKNDAKGAWQEIRLSPRETGGAEMHARAVRTSNRILLIVDESGDSARRDELDSLRAHIGDLEQLAATDHLTGAWNRAHLDRVIESELSRSVAGRQPLSLILFDVDHFKSINDGFGHAVGDMVLCDLVRLARSRLRSSDLLFRWGGEEFVVLLSSAGYRLAERVAEKLRKVVAGHSFEHAGTVTISLGVAEHDGNEEARGWFHRLDEALYEAKRSGRNRMVVARGGNSDAWAADGGASALHLTWQEGYECGDPTIDEEHRELFRLSNKLIDASLRGQTEAAAFKGALEALLIHVRRHFAHEEEILERLRYAELEEHRRAHAGLVRRALAMAARVDTGEAGLGAIVEFLAQDVVARHLLAVDRAFFPLFRPAAAPTERD